MSNLTKNAAIQNTDQCQLITPTTVQPQHHIYPFCIVWTTLPLISFILPFIGHTGLGSTKGIIHDFAGSRLIGTHKLSFHRPLRYAVLDHQTAQLEWDQILSETNLTYSHLPHNLLTNNCHHHVAYFLNKIRYQGRNNWNPISVALLVWTKGHWTDSAAACEILLPCLFLWGLILFLLLGLPLLITVK